MKTRAAAKTSMLAILTIFLMYGISFSAVMPEVKELLRVPGLVSPTNVAVSADRRLFIVEGDRDRVQIFRRSGSSAGLLHVAKPSSVAVSPSGTVYVGSRKDFSVGIYNAKGEKIGQLGDGEDEFINPHFIYFDAATGSVYVVDKNTGVIKKYDENGVFIGEAINDAGNHPEAMTIYNNEFYVIDSPPATDLNGKPYSSARVQVFDMAGKPVRSFGSWGYNVGQFRNPAGITHDSQGRIYVSDGSVGILCFDGQTGSYIDMIYPLASPLGVAMSDDNRLLVATPGSHSAAVFGVGSYSDMKVAPESLAFHGTDVLPKPSSQQITITNSGTAQLTYSATHTASWLSLQGGSGLVASQGEAGVTVSVDGSGLQPGVYHDVVTVKDDTGASESVAISFEIRTSPKLTLSPMTGLSYSYTMGSPNPMPQAITITVVDDADGTATWRANIAGAAWLGLSPSSSTGNGTTVLQTMVDPAGLSAGSYQGTITVSSSGISGTPVSIPVNLEIKDVPVLRKSGGGNIVASPTMTTTGYAKVGIFDQNGIKQFEFDPFGLKSKHGYNVATGDVDGDGSVDIIVGMGSVMKNPARMAVFTRNGEMVPGTDLTPLSSRSGAKVASGDFNGDGRAEVIVAAGQGPMNAAQLKILVYDGEDLKETGVDIVPFDTHYGVNVAAGDLDGDGIDELMVSPGPDPRADAAVKVFKIDSSGGLGAWTAAETGAAITAFSSRCGANVSSGDVNGDGKAEIIVSSGSCAYIKRNRIAFLDGEGNRATPDIVDSSSGGLVTAAEDLDMDGRAEIVAAPIKRGYNSAIIRIYDAGGGILKNTFSAYSTAVSGANIAAGELGWGVE